MIKSPHWDFSSADVLFEETNPRSAHDDSIQKARTPELPVIEVNTSLYFRLRYFVVEIFDIFH